MSLYIHNKKRSVTSYIIEKYIATLDSKKNLSTRELTLKHLDHMGMENIKPYHIGKVKLASPLTEHIYEDIQVFTLNDQHSRAQKVILYIHGGAHTHQPLSLHWKFMDRMAQALHAKVIAPIYPKVPHYNYQHTYPKLLQLYRDILGSVDHPAQITIMGDSAGGNISLGLAHYVNMHDLPQPKDIILLSPCVDMVLDNPVIFDYETRDPMLAVEGYDVIRRIWAADKPLHDPLISPIYGNFNGLGKISIFIGTHEGLFPDNMRLDKLLTDQRIEHHTYVYPKMNHVFVLYPIPEARDARRKIINIINTTAPEYETYSNQS
ncbi:alpha/beta hydrolase [Paenibacillus barcinonensis]|uniref:alpha/beta hydrolase fold domain-containing protein n=2 Tax=Paenibacillus TaxID=44249 RepID=UPI001C11ADFD|nr:MULTISPECIES: alpha/beta hydrolase [Paenibacillus]MBU5354638.1 alpha/beta hydrolase [Paenibacillus barcinonensis]MDM5279813.1 alpha/beta hydrolase [Paenibacillus silvae]